MLEKEGYSKRKELRLVASLNLTKQGVNFFDKGDYDNAISMFERSIGIDSGNGKNYYYLSQIWLMKGNIKQAEEFNNLALIYLENDVEWKTLVEEQKREIKIYKYEQNDS